MKITRTELEGLLVVEPDVHRDPRGFFVETYHAGKYADAGIPASFVQDNHSASCRGTLRGLHAQRLRPQGKLVRVVRGSVFDVAVDVRRGSTTFGRWYGVELSAESFRQCYVPPGFLHGFCVLSDVAEVEYKVTQPYDPSDEIGVIWNDPEIGIAWPVAAPILSARDAVLPRLADVRGLL